MASAPNKSGATGSRFQDEGWTVGVLVGHGPAPYDHNPDNKASYYLRIRTLETEEGARRSAMFKDESARPIDGRTQERGDARERASVRIGWGDDIKRAIEKSKSHVKTGQLVGARKTGREPVYGPDNKIIEGRYKNKWEIETVQFIKQRHVTARKVNEDYRAARQAGMDDPAATALYMIHSGAEKLAPLWYPNPEDQKRFIEAVRRAVEQSPQREALIARVAQRIQANKTTGNPDDSPRSRPRESNSPEPRREELARE
jgi:hypothetical protein